MRNITIRARIILLICIAVIFSAFVGGSFLYKMFELKTYAVAQTEGAMLAGEKDKLQVSVHALCVSLGEAVKDLSGDKALAAETIRKLTKPIRYEEDKSGYFFVFEGTVYVAHPTKPEMVGKEGGEIVDGKGLRYIKAMAEAAAKGGGFVSYATEKPGKGVQPKLSYAEMIPGTNYWIGTGVYIDNIDVEKAKIGQDISSMVKNATMTIAGIVLALLILGVLPLSVLIFRSIILPLNAATKAAQDVAGGALDVSLTVVGKDETSRLETALNTMVATLRTNMAQIKVKTQEAEDKAHAAEMATNEANEAKAQAIRSRQEGLLQAANRLEAVVERLSSASEEISGQAVNISRSTEVQKGRITETA
ncbi:MAG: cache domain-containing protein, partial [Humidesulfovibrio sp.]|nr:cache domain-containing protein [Humidesulfovibrio sp.]